MTKYPEFFGLDCSRGLDIHVCQFAASSYSLKLSEHGKTLALNDIFGSGATVSISEMRQILKTYDITYDKVDVIPWQNPASSYIGQYFMLWEGQPKELKAAYIYNIYLLLFDDAYALLDAHFDTYIYDIDSDGIAEICSLGFGTTSGLWSFMVSAREVYDTEAEYLSVIIPHNHFSSMRFDHGRTDGIGVMGYDKDTDIWHKFDVKFENGEITLYQNGTEVDHFVGGTAITPLE